MGGDTRRGVYTKVRMNIDKAGSDPAVTGIDCGGIGPDLSCADPLDLPVGDVEVCIVKAAAITGEDGGILEQYRRA
jgi:hypothetical protein